MLDYLYMHTIPGVRNNTSRRADRHAQSLKVVGQGQSNKQIARSLNNTEKTIKLFFPSLYQTSLLVNVIAGTALFGTACSRADP